MGLAAFLNSQEMAVDAKKRVGIPERFVRVLKQRCPNQWSKVGIVATPDRSIKVMPYPYFEKEIEKWERLDDRSADQRMVLNLYSAFADEVSLDKQNRIKLSPTICKFCEIDHKVMVVGSLMYMQIFDLDVWASLVRNGREKFASASESVAKWDLGRNGGSSPLPPLRSEEAESGEE